MVNTINPQGTGPVSGRTTTAKGRRPADDEAAGFSPPRRAEQDFIPSVESLATLIQSAVAALRKGVYWDRGTILNILS